VDKKIFVQNIKKACAMRGIKPTVACRESGVGSSFINNIKSRNQTPSVEKVQMLAQYLGVTTSELLGETIPAEDETTLGKMVKALQVELKQSQLDALDRLLGGLVTRCEAEAAALAPLGERGRKLAEQRLRDAEEAEALWDFFLHV